MQPCGPERQIGLSCGPPGWESIAGLLERFTNKGSGLHPSTENLWKTTKRSARGVLVEPKYFKIRKIQKKRIVIGIFQSEIEREFLKVIRVNKFQRCFE